MSGTPRPTLRCVREDLGDDWGDPGHARAAHSGDTDALPPLSSLDHPVVRHVVATFADGDGQLNRESISGLSDPMWWKLKTGRWRGAVYVDDGGQAWLCAAGLRREREATDFYKMFSRSINAGGATAYLPTDEDRARLRRVRVEDSLRAWEVAVHEAAIRAVLTASTDGVASIWEVPSLGEAGASIGRVEIQVERISEDDGEALGEIVVSVEVLDFARIALLERAEIIALSAIVPDEQAWVSAPASAHRIYSVCDSGELIDRYLGAAESTERAPGQSEPGAVAHYAHKDMLTDHYVDGTATRALCGVYFVPRRAPDGLDACPVCALVLRMMKE